MGRGRAFVGMSGWVYPPWRGVFYPKGLAQKSELAYASSHVTSIEINGSFYGLPKPKTWQSWRDGTPDGFVLSVKGPRLITHMKRLNNARLPLANFFASGVLSLDAKLGALLWQLPPNLAFDPDVLERFLALLPRTTTEALALAQHREELMGDRVWLGPVEERPLRHSMEVRNATFDDERYFALLDEFGVASVLADTAGKWPRFERDTADFTYVRLHGDKILYESGYDDDALDAWAARVDGWRDAGRDVYVYFDNDIKVRAPVDAMGLIARLQE
ncbi:MAG: hypothetical protein JWP85_1475 [Rhodoglobus sp.]|nr:hypothetical protein [Rhodoglobus sp.]